jgi:hypothetical protein
LKITTEHEWIDWVFRLKQQDLRHSLEFVEAWNPTRIAVVGLILLLVSTVLSVVWSVRGSGIQNGIAIAGFILTAGSCELYSCEGCLKINQQDGLVLLALLAIVSGVELSAQSNT